MASTLFCFFFLMLTYAFGTVSDGIYLHTRHDGKLFNLKWLRAKTKVTCVLIREMLFSDDAALISNTGRLSVPHGRIFGSIYDSSRQFCVEDNLDGD